jgi:hypothetical protein
MGEGIFSDQCIFKPGNEVDDEAKQAYFKRANDTFSKSSEARQAIERYGSLGWFESLLGFGLDYLGEIVDSMTVRSLQEFVRDYVPRKVSAKPEAAKAIVGELRLFWQYLDRVYKLPEANAIVQWLGTGGLVDELKAKMSNPANFGMAKSIVMMGMDAGYDMGSQEGMDTLMADFNRGLVGRGSAPFPTVPNYHVGRNEPCPCGSGKTFKKCCARRSGE